MSQEGAPSGKLIPQAGDHVPEPERNADGVAPRRTEAGRLLRDNSDAGLSAAA